MFRELAGSTGKEVELTDQDFVTLCDSVQVVAANLDNTPVGTRFVSETRIIWNASTKTWAEFACLVEGIAISKHGNQYLEGPDYEISVEVSVDEYGSDLWLSKF